MQARESQKKENTVARNTGAEIRKKKIQSREMLGMSRALMFFLRICGSRGSKSRLAKAAGAKPCGQRRN